MIATSRAIRPGLRTTILVALAACLSMVQASWLMNSVGKAPDSFVVLDLMRLPLGILTGVGFIGGGAILKRGDSIQGVTTAATLWFVTVIGLCFGGGQNELGVTGAALGLLTLRALKFLERKVEQKRVSELRMKWKIDQVNAAAVLSELRVADLQIFKFAVREDTVAHVQELRCPLKRRALRDDHGLPSGLAEVTRRPGVLEWEWKD